MYMDSGLLIFILLIGLIILGPIVVVVLNFKKLLNWRSVIITATLLITIGGMIPPLVHKDSLLVILIFGIAGGGLGGLTMYIFSKMFPDIFKNRKGHL